MVSVVLAICTCRRPEGLRRLLDAVATLETEAALSVVVVDNDAAGAGLAVCEALAPAYRWPLLATLEPQRGISYARNRAVALALARQPAFIAMLDDDEWPCPAWLRVLLQVQAETGADVVAGPVLPEFSRQPPAWMRREGLFGTEQQPDRSRGVFYASGNFLARAACFQALMPTPFDPAFALSGGEDLVFFRQLAARGYQMVWAADAHVLEIVPPSRMTLAWLKQRQYRRGNLNVIVQRMFAPGPFHELVRLAKTAALLSLSAGWYLLAWPHVESRRRALLQLCVAIGKIKAHLGLRHFEYTQIHGR
jgi:GT2 family glycosyltransferase